MLVVLVVLLYSGLNILGLAGTATDLRKQKINTEWCVLVLQVSLELCDLLPKHVGCVSNTSNDTNTSSVGDSGCELRASGDVHASKHDRVVDLQEIGRDRADLLCRSVSWASYGV